MGLALMALIWLITLISTYFFVAKTWWLPVGASAATEFIDHQFAVTFVLMGIVFLAAQLGLGYIVWKYRQTPTSPPVSYSHGNTTLEIDLDGAHGGLIHRTEPDGQPRMGEPAF